MSARILIIEDNAVLRTMIVRRLLRYGYQCEIAEDGEQSIETAQKEPPELILLDMTLPRKDGHTIARELKADETLEKIPIIAITAQAMIGDRERVLASGCDEYMSKPIDFDELHAKMQALLSRG